jgi:hypothetical protein
MCQGTKDWTIRGLVASTLRDHGAQRELKTFQFFNLLLSLGDALHLRTRAASLGEPQEQADLLERENL